MDIVPYIFQSCRVCGIWYENSSYLPLKILYTGFIAFIFITFLLSQLIELARTHHTLSEISGILFGAFNFISGILKALNFMIRQNCLQNLLKDFRLPGYQSQSSAEEVIIRRYNNFLSRMVLSYWSLTLTTGLLSSVVPVLVGKPHLPYEGYQVVNISEPIGFGVAFSFQFVAVFYLILMSATLDAMAYGLMILTTGQVELNCHRVVNSTMPLRRCIEHQVFICDTAQKIQNFIMPVVVPQFFFSLTTLCTSIFLMSQLPVTDAAFTSYIMRFACMLSQVFFYCWFGNELKLKNQELITAAYTSNWVNCNVNERKTLWLVMLHSNRAATISYHNYCSLILDTFIWILKTSYTAFTLLRKIQV